jgi:phenylpyruvate tautomerase PptA (4-oxalocrotonate tautomerase family)
MANEDRRSELAAEITELHKQQLDATSSATFVGWTPVETAAYDRRIERIALLNAQLAGLDRT